MQLYITFHVQSLLVTSRKSSQGNKMVTNSKEDEPGQQTTTNENGSLCLILQFQSADVIGRRRHIVGGNELLAGTVIAAATAAGLE